MGININKVTYDMYNKNSEKLGALRKLRDRIYEARKQGLSNDEVIEDALKFAKSMIEAGTVTKDDVKNEITKMLNAKIDTKTR